MSNKPTCIVQSPVFLRSGYSGLSEAICKSLLRYNKYDLMLSPTVWGSCSKKNLEEDMNDPEGRELFNRILKTPLSKQPDLFIQITIPNEFTAPAKYNIGITAGLESNLVPGIWLEGMNRMNLNLVTSIHSKDVFVKSLYNKKNPNGTIEPLKLDKPIEVLFWGMNTKTFYKTNEKDPILDDTLKSIKESFAFLFVGQWTSGNINADRKNIGYLIKTFLETFKDIKNPPCLILKTSGAQISTMDRHDCINKIHEVTGMVKSQFPNSILPNVYLLHGELTDREMNLLYNHEKVKVHISFTRGEGFSAPALLSTLSGKPTIYPKWSGHLDFLNPNYADFFEGGLVPIPQEAVNDWFIKEAQWFNVDYDAAGKKMKQYFLYYNDKILEKAEKLRAENAIKFSTEAMDKKFHAILDKYVPEFVVESKIVLPPLRKLNLPKLRNPADTSASTFGGASPQTDKTSPPIEVKKELTEVK